MAGFQPIKDERGKQDLFGNAMTVTQIGVADALAVCAQVVMGERDEATPFAVARGADIEFTDAPLSADAVSIPWRHCIYIQSLTLGLIPVEAPTGALILSARQAQTGPKTAAGKPINRLVQFRQTCGKEPLLPLTSA